MKIKAFFLILLSSVLLPLALPNDILPYGSAALGFICFVPFFLALMIAPSLGFASILGMVFAGLSTIIAHYWLLFYEEYSFWTVTGIVIGYMGYHALLAPIISSIIKGNKTYRILLFALIWTIYEYLKSSGFLGFPWCLLPHTVHSMDILIQIADITGIWGITFIVAVVNGYIGDFIYRTFFESKIQRVSINKESGLFILSCLCLTTIYGLYMLVTPLPYEETIKVVLVQQNDDPWVTVNKEKIVKDAMSLSAEGIEQGRPDLVVWSETSYPYYFREEYFNNDFGRIPGDYSLKEYVKDVNAYFLLGIVLKPKNMDGYQNATVFVSPEGEMIDFYAKQHLVPIAETIPFYDWAVFKAFFKDILGLSKGWIPGTEYTLYPLTLQNNSEIKIATPICFEDSFPYLCRNFVNNGADIIINLSNVAWSKQKSAEIQMYVASIFRAVENRCVLIRSTNAGVTGIIGPKGDLLTSLELFVADSMYFEVPVYKPESPTFYTLFGDYLPLVFSVVLLSYLISGIILPLYRKWVLRYQVKHRK